MPLSAIAFIFTHFKRHTLTDNLSIDSSLMFFASVLNSAGTLSVLLQFSQDFWFHIVAVGKHAIFTTSLYQDSVYNRLSL